MNYVDWNASKKNYTTDNNFRELYTLIILDIFFHLRGWKME